MSLFCPHCKKRVILEDFRIKTYHAVRLFVTCGDVLVERSGHIAAPIKVGNITIRGTVRGNIQARGTVEVGKTGRLTGDIRARHLVVRDGGIIVGRCHIGPDGADPRNRLAAPACPTVPLSRKIPEPSPRVS